MTISELYNVLEKAIDSGEATLNSDVYFRYCYSQRSRIPIIYPISESEIDSDGDLILTK
jgi:hypothetical protein